MEGSQQCQSHPIFATVRRLGALAVLCAATFIAARAEQGVPGLTGIDHAAEVVQARQLLMSQIDDEMQPVDLVAGGKDLSLDELKSNANRISIMLGAFPHLFPPQTKPGPDAFSTAAAPAIWQDFEAFYGQTDAAAKRRLRCEPGHRDRPVSGQRQEAAGGLRWLPCASI